MDTTSDWSTCEQLIEQGLTPEQRQVLDGPPVWVCDPPQRESYDEAADYVSALSDYTHRVIAEGMK